MEKEQLEKELLELTEKKDATNRQLDESLRAINEAKIELEGIQSDIQEAQDKKVEITKEYEAIVAQGEPAAQKVADIDREITGLNQKISDVQTAVTSLEDQKTTLLQQIQALETEKAEKKAAIDLEVANYRKTLSDETNVLQEQKKSMELDNSALVTRRMSLEAENSRIDGILADKTTLLAETNTKLNEVDSVFSGINEAIVAKRQELSTAEEALELSRNELTATESKLADRKEALESLKAALEPLQAEEAKILTDKRIVMDLTAQLNTREEYIKARYEQIGEPYQPIERP